MHFREDTLILSRMRAASACYKRNKSMAQGMAYSERTHVLMVDDEPDLLDISKAFLEKDGRFDVDTSSSAMEALHAMDVSGYDAIVSDYQMPGMDGIEFLRQLRMKDVNVPFILFTGRGREEVAITALNAGADFYLKKGTDVKAQYAELSNCIDHAVARYGAIAAVEHNLRRFRVLVESTSEIIEIVDSDRTIRYVNPAVERYFGRKPEEIIGKRLLFSLPEREQERLEGGLRSLLEGKTEKAKALVKARHVDGSVHLLDVTITRFVNGRFKPELIINAKEVPMEQNDREPGFIV